MTGWSSKNKKTVELDPNFCGSYGHLTNIYERRRMYRQAVDQWKRIALVKERPAEAAEVERISKVRGYPGVMRYYFD